MLKAVKVYCAGRNGYTHKILWRTYVAMTILSLPLFAVLVRALQNNPYLAETCGITSPNALPPKFTYSRFLRKFQTRNKVALVKDVMRTLGHKCCEILPGSLPS